MYFQTKLFLILTCLIFSLTACSTSTSSPVLVEKVLTKAEQDSLTPDEVIEMLKKGNENFVNGKYTVRDHSSQVRASATGQFPKAIVLSCVDSRVPVEDVFDRGIGDLFVARVAGNFENTDILGSIEFATKVAGAKVILVLGHGYCGAVKGAIDNVQVGHIGPMIDNIKPAIRLSSEYAGEKTSKNDEFVQIVIDKNVLVTMNDIRSKSKIVQELEQEGKVKVIGGVYDMYSGRVSFIE